MYATSPNPTTRRRHLGLAAVALLLASAGIWCSPPAIAAPVDSLRAAVEAARAASSCDPLRSDPVVERVAEVVNQSVYDWLDHTASYVPIEDPLPGLKELGYPGNRGVMFGGASPRNQVDAIRGALLEGWDKIPNCSYSHFGVSMMFNERTGQTITAVVLAGA